MYNQPHRRRKKRQTHGLKTVEVSRGRNGYGFTLSGQNPCVLSCVVPSSPAERAGLKTGDHLFSVNGLDVSRAGHDDVVRLVGSSSGLLILQIAENFNSSDSSDDEYHSRAKSKYPNRAKLRQAQNRHSHDDFNVAYNRGGRVSDQGPSRHAAGGRRQLAEQAKLRAMSPGPELERHGNYDRHILLSAQSRPSRVRGIENQDPLAAATGAVPKRYKQSGNAGIIRYRSPNTKHTIITREARLGGQKPCKDEAGQAHPHAAPPPPPHVPTRLHRPTSHPHSSVSQLHDISCHTATTTTSEDTIDEEEDGEQSFLVTDFLRVIVGYLGSIEMPRDSRVASSRLHSIRGAVRRLRVERKIHTMVLMEIATNGIRLINTMGSTVANYPCQKIAFSGVCPDDKRFFGIVTLNVSQEVKDGVGHGEPLCSSSCHVFMVDPELSVHSVHIHKARNFGIHCTLHSLSQRCMEFPRSSIPVIGCMAHLYRERPSALYESEMAQIGAFEVPNFVGQSNESTSSTNSDSGLGLTREKNGKPPAASDRVCVVEMPHNNTQQSEASMHWDMDHTNNHSILNNTTVSSSSGLYQTAESNSSAVSSVERYPAVGRSATATAAMAASFTSPVTNDSSLCQNDTTERLKVQVRPEVDEQNSAENIRRSMQKIMQSIQHNQTTGSTSDSSQTGGAGLCSLSSSSSSSSEAGKQGPNIQHVRSISLQGTGLSSSTVSTPMAQSTQLLAGAEPSSHVAHDTVCIQPPLPPRGSLKPGVSHLVSNKLPIPERQPIIARLPKALRRPPQPEITLPKSTALLAAIYGGQDVGRDRCDSELSSEMEVEHRTSKVPQNKTSSQTTSEQHQAYPIAQVFVPPKEQEKYAVKVSPIRKAGSFKHPNTKRRQPLSSSHESLVVSDADFGKSSQLNGATSVTLITNRGLTVEPDEASNCIHAGRAGRAGRAASWAVSFEKLLHDSLGITVFTDFLKKEFSEENIIFWLACEEYKKISDAEQRKARAQEIFENHIASDASEPVNVDSQARLCTQKQLEEQPGTDIFDAAKNQILRLMKQDSYSRFLKCDLYKECVMAEMEGRPLPHMEACSSKGEQDSQCAQNEKDKDNARIRKPLKKSKSSSSCEETGDDKRRRSLLPWGKGKNDKKFERNRTDPELRKLVSGSMSSLEGTPEELIKPNMELADLSLLSREVAPATEDANAQLDKGHKFCRIILPDNSTTVVLAKPGHSLRESLAKLCEKRSLHLALIDILQIGAEKPVDLQRDISSLGSKELRLEKRVVLRADLPNRKTIGIRAKPTKSIREVFHPIMLKYGFTLDNNTVLHVAGTGVVLNDDQEIGLLENKQVVIQSLDDFKGKKKREWGSFGSHRGLTTKPPIPRASRDSKNSKSLDEVFSQLFKDASDCSSGVVTASMQFDENGIWDPLKSRQEAKRNSGLMGFIRRNSLGEKEGSKLKAKSKSAFGSRRLGSSTNLITKQNATPSNGAPGSIPAAAPSAEQRRAKFTDKDDENLFELLSRAQSRQMDDQRGLAAKDFELPEFLKVDKEGVGGPSDGTQTHCLGANSSRPITHSSSTADLKQVPPNFKSRYVESENGPLMSNPGVLSHRRTASDISLQSSSEDSTPGQISIKSLHESPYLDRLPYVDESFSQDGVVPSQGEAEVYFKHVSTVSCSGSPDFEDSGLMEKSLRDLGMSSSSFPAFGRRNFYSQDSTPMPSPVVGETRNPSTHPCFVPVPQPLPLIPKRLNPPAVEYMDLGKALVAKCEEELDMTLMPPSPDSSNEEGLPSPPIMIKALRLEDMEEANYPPPTPLTYPNATENNNCLGANINPGVSTFSIGSQNEVIDSRLKLICPIDSDVDIELLSIGSEISQRSEEVDQEMHSPSSTPSPTTHDLVFNLDDEQEADSCQLTPPPSNNRTSILKKHQHKPTVKKTLSFDASEANGDLLVSFV